MINKEVRLEGWSDRLGTLARNNLKGVEEIGTVSILPEKRRARGQTHAKHNTFSFCMHLRHRVTSHKTDWRDMV